MLVDKRKAKTSRKKTRKESLHSDDTIQSFRSWIRKLEQTTNSLSARLSAVEKRITREKLSYSTNPLSESIMEGPIEKIFTFLKEEKKDKNIEELSRILDNEFTIIQDELMELQHDINALKEKIAEHDSCLANFEREIKNTGVYSSRVLDDVNIRLERIESRKTPSMSLGGMEIPVEITGVIGGILVFIIAILVAMGQSEIVISPLFLSIAGLVLIGSAVFKMFNFGSSAVKPLKKISKVEDHS